MARTEKQKAVPMRTLLYGFLTVVAVVVAGMNVTTGEWLDVSVALLLAVFFAADITRTEAQQ